MARRLVSSEVFHHPVLLEMPLSATLLWIGLVTETDTKGQLCCESRYLKRRFFSGRRHPCPTTIASFIDRFEACKMLLRYRLGDVTYCKLTAFEKWQKLKGVGREQNTREQKTTQQKGNDACVVPKNAGEKTGRWDHLEQLAKQEPTVRNPRGFRLDLEAKYDDPAEAKCGFWVEPSQAAADGRRSELLSFFRARVGEKSGDGIIELPGIRTIATGEVRQWKTFETTELEELAREFR